MNSRTLMRLFLFLAVFSIEVRVRAEILRETHDPLQEPEACLKEAKSECAFETAEGERFRLALKQGEMILGSQTSVVRGTDGEVRLVRGALWVRPEKSSVTVRSEFGSAAGRSSFWVIRKDQRMTVWAISGEVSMTARGGSESLVVPPGLENFLGRVTKEGVAHTGLPTLILPSALIDRWASVYPGKKSDLEKELAQFRETWVGARDEAARIHRAVFERKVASLEAQAHAQASARKKVEGRNRELRDLFRAKFLSGE